jgi:phenylpropionate dioxygenase-like ring-hydroxylating dioxygenase large terminal subunit
LGFGDDFVKLRRARVVPGGLQWLPAPAAVGYVRPMSRLVDLRASITPYPRGWYAAVESEDLEVGGVVPVKMFGRELVAFRTEDGQAHVVNAFCPHFGAHLGHGGEVDGGCIRCPFHGWEFRGADGQCAHIPSGDPFPPKARLQRWPVDEVQGVVLVWFHETGADPDWHVTAPDDFVDDSKWSRWQKYTWEIPSTIQDVSENDADVSHSPALHRFVDAPANLEMDVDGPVCDWRMRARVHAVSFLGLQRLRQPPRWFPFSDELDVLISIRRHCLSLGWIRQRTPIAGGFEFTTQTLGSTTPIDDGHVRLVMRHRVRKTPSRAFTRLMLDNYSRLFNSTLEEDVVMWSKKIYRMRPAASKGDWAIMKFRKWSRQFYPPGEYERAMREPIEPRGDDESKS